MRFFGIFCVCLLLWPGTAAQSDDLRLDGFSRKSSEWQLQFEQFIAEQLSAKNAEKHLQWLTARPHRAGTDGARVTANYIKEQLQGFGLPAEILILHPATPAGKWCMQTTDLLKISDSCNPAGSI
jgi:hypothetical protein